MFLNWVFELFDASGFLTLGNCGSWSASLKQAYIASNALIALAYFLIPISLFVLWKNQRRDISRPGIFLGFAVFIASSGLTHVCDVVVFWWPAYRLYTLIDAFTAVSSIGTALILPSVVHLLLRVPTPDQIRRVHDELRGTCAMKDRAIKKLNETIDALQRQVEHLERMRQTGLWFADQAADLHELKAILQSSFAGEEA